jgi:hypothetical protein
MMEEMRNLAGFFHNRGYDRNIIETAIERALNHKYDDKRSDTYPENKHIPTALIVPYHPNNPPFQKIINRIWSKYEKTLKQLDWKASCGTH